MRVGTIVRLKIDCLGNKKGTLGVVFYDYGDGFQAIFENGGYDGFSERPGSMRDLNRDLDPKSEATFFLEEVGFEPSLANYQFQNVVKVSWDLRKGLFNIVWKKWK